ncbi:histone-like nucleoid-structuring protein Lsr2 [Rhizohabitans arisaemae]|uniref:histone-like nucleoid-structuring protein Lsr2 n=1 Tax=Rhizohabitans arisaemae TaxID=2720610 RepID=UPI0024B0A7FE|nr:Lsr2 family protein [Rhizohabitans arisaemae]
MAKKTVVVDDLDQTSGAETVYFALDGVTYEIDLNEGNASKLRNALTPFIEKGRKVGGGTRRALKPSRGMSRDETAKIREWAKEQGQQVSERGRIAQRIVDLYNAAH